MKKKERASFVLAKLNELYPKPPIPLDHHDHFSLLIAVLLSAQCTDKMVNKVTPSLWAAASTPADLVALGETRVREIIRPCGLSPQKAKAIVALSQILIDQYNGQIPDTLEALETLPGVGHKTASVVMCQAFGQPAFPIDTHIHRLAARWGLSNGHSVVQTERDLKSLFAEDTWSVLHLQIIYYGREYCTARGCDGTKCEMCKTLYPNRKPPAKKKRIKPVE
jgi:endonuclease III